MRKKYLFYVLAIVSSFILAIVATMDSTICFIFHQNSWNYWVCALAVFLVGAPITLLIVFILSLPINGKSLGSKLDPSFKRIRLVKREELSYYLLAGAANAIQTAGYYLILSRFGDPSMALPFNQIVILYLLSIESIAEKNSPTMAELQCAIIVTFGAIMSSLSMGGLDIKALLVVFLIINPGWCVVSIYQRKLKLLKFGGKPNDSINIRFWNVIFSTIFVVLIALIVDKSLLLQAFYAASKYFPLLGVLMSLGFFSYVLYIRALGIGKASVTQAIRASSIIFVIPFSILLGRFFYADSLHLLIKLMGIVLVILGITSLSLTDVKAYLFINVKQGYSKGVLMEKIWKIKGVESIATIAGGTDLIAKVRTRSLGKGYERVIRRLEEVEGIEEFKWQSILKEWEEI